MLRRFDEIVENDRQFLVNLQHEIRRNLFIQDWIEIVWTQFIDQTFEWINNEKKTMIILDKKSFIEIDKKKFIQRICEKYFVVKKFVVFCEQYVVKKSVVKQFVAIKIIHMQQEENEIIREYYLRIHDVLVATDDMNILLFSIIRHWINELNNKKLFAHLVNRLIDQSSLYDVCIIAERKFRQKKKRKRQKKKTQKILQHQLQNIVDRDVVRTRKFYEFLLILKQMSCNLSKINVAVNIRDIESIDEIFAFEFDKWIVVVARKKIFDYTNTFDETSKNSIELASNNSFDWSRCYTVDLKIVDMKILNQKIFDFAVTLDEVSKNSLALFIENMKISIATNMSSLKHLMNMNDSAIETFDFDIAMNASLKNSSSQHIANSKTMKKNSIFIYELSAFSAFDLNIDIDFEIYTIDSEITCSSTQSSVTSFRRKKMQLSSFRNLALRNISFDWSRCCTNSIDSRIFSISFYIAISVVTSDTNVSSIDTVNIEFCEKKQSFCSSIELSASTSVNVISISENIDFYERKQSFCFINVICTFVVVVNIHAALTLIVDMIMKKSVRMSFSNSIKYLISKSKYKKLSKVKIKRY